ncbi:hypothetical protein PISL3812_05868 [Talaromyces islandicus]|uniref:Sld7 C-terminal domain-containing protein n=1 Tax=Talaromyces islandicus TaxID=28573 RepID=A0A0U1LZV4_TALIS|nr:hypothetical protein PISL3812_05868 [Talaromyces islandicus]
MDLWSGSIPTGSFDLNIKLVNANPKRDHTIPPKSRLSFHSFVNPALIPLYARAGPSVEVHTANAESAEWLKTKILGSLWLEEWGDDQEEAMERASVEIQCPVALLLTVDSQASDLSHTNVSDLLVYGILTAASSQDRPPAADRLPSPSGSPSGDGNQLLGSRRRELRIYAAPLATSYVQKAQDLPSPPSSPIEGDNNNTRSCEDGLAQFLPDLRSPNPKRKRMLSIFDTAAQHHRRVRQYGGQAVAQMMATTKSQTHQTQPLKIKREPTDDATATTNNSNNKLGLDRLGGLRRARSLSIGGNHFAKLENTRVAADETRPSSSRGLQQQARRMISKNDGGSHSFHEFERSRSIAPTSNLASCKEALAETEHDLSTLSSTSSNKTREMLVASNKDVITRTILTGMRLYGYHRKPNRATAKPATVANSELDGIGEDGTLTPTMAEDCSRQSVTDEDDFKAMYHATYKAATFALRHYLKTDTINTTINNNEHDDRASDRGMQKPGVPAVLSRDTATNVIDEILKLFCDDQLKPAG